MKYIHYTINFVILTSILLMYSCSQEMEELTMREQRSPLQMNMYITSYSSESNALEDKSTASDGDVVYLCAANGTTGIARYQNNRWVLEYSGEVTETQTCNLYYFKNATSHDASCVNLSHESSVNKDDNAVLSRIDDDIILTGHLSPLTARFRFKGQTGNNIRVKGWRNYTKYNISTGSLESELNSEEVSLSPQDGVYTPYIYASPEDQGQELALTTNGKVYSRTLSANELGPGCSGYFTCPSLDNLHGWKYISEAPPQKWDGTKSTEFAGGSGSLADPYQIETGGQLLHIMDISSAGKYFVLKNSIDLNNYNWKPVKMEGTFDGGGFTISNLKIDRDEDKLGLFSIASKVKDLTIKSVQIESNSYFVGTLAGELTTSAINVNVVLNEDSYIKGNDAYTGGLVGYLKYNALIESCSVESKTEKFVIMGNSGIGGIVGWTERSTGGLGKTDIKKCHVKANILGDNSIGGIVGNGDSDIINCSFTGKIKSEENAGGIIGCTSVYPNVVTACKVVADIEGTKSIGGLIGFNRSYKPKYIACYFTGSIKALEDYNCFNGGYSSGSYVEFDLCYAATEDIYPKYWEMRIRDTDCATTTGELTKEDIATYLQETYSEYCKYYNFSNKWYWEGTINGKKVRVPCPKLSWE